METRVALIGILIDDPMPWKKSIRSFINQAAGLSDVWAFPITPVISTVGHIFHAHFEIILCHTSELNYRSFLL